MLRCVGFLLATVALATACASFHENPSTAIDAGGEAAPKRGSLLDATTDARRDASGEVPPDATDATPVADSGAETGGGSDAVADSGGAPGDAGCGDAGCGEIVLASSFMQATVVVVDGENAYVSDPGTEQGSVYQCPKSDCGTPILLGPGQATGIVVTGGQVYWSDSVGNEIVSCAIGGCGGHPTPVVENQLGANALGYDGARFYWSAGGAILTAPTLGGGVSTLATNVGNEVSQIASGEGTAFWMASLELHACEWGGCGGTATELASAVGGSVITYQTRLYFTNNNAVDECPVSPVSCTPDTIGDTYAPFGLATDGVYLYWLDDIETGVFRCPASGVGCGGGGEMWAASNESSVNATIALDDDYVYWTATNQLLRQHK